VTVPDTATEGSPVTLTAAATDPAGANDPLLFQWTIPQRDGSIFLSVGPTLDYTPADDGGYLVFLSVSDGDGGSDFRITTLNVGNVAPTAAITGLPASGHSPEGTAITLGSAVTDPSPVDQAAGFTYAWSVTKNGSAYASGSAADFTFTPYDNGTYV